MILVFCFLANEYLSSSGMMAASWAAYKGDAIPDVLLALILRAWDSQTAFGQALRQVFPHPSPSLACSCLIFHLYRASKLDCFWQVYFDLHRAKLLMGIPPLLYHDYCLMQFLRET